MFRSRLKNNIKVVVQGIVWEGEDSTHPAQDTNKCLAVVYVAMNLAFRKM